MSEEEVKRLRQQNIDNLLLRMPFKHPVYPPPFNDYPRCCYEGFDDLFGHLPPSQHSNLVRTSPDSDPFSVYNLGLAQQAIDRYRSVVPYPAWSSRIAEYPVPDWMNELSMKTLECTYSQIETDAGWRAEWYFDHVMDLLELRAFVLGCLTGEEDPAGMLIDCLNRHKTRPIEDIQSYLPGIARRNGVGWPDEPRVSSWMRKHA